MKAVVASLLAVCAVACNLTFADEIEWKAPLRAFDKESPSLVLTPQGVQRQEAPFRSEVPFFAQLRDRAGAVVSRSAQRTLSGDHLSLRGDGVQLHLNAASAHAVDPARGRDLATPRLQVAKHLSATLGA